MPDGRSSRLATALAQLRLPVYCAAVVGVALLTTVPDAGAQTACRTSNCDLETSPPLGCTNRAAPRTLGVEMTFAGGFVFVPSNPKIEPGDCVAWDSLSSTHSSTEDACPDGNLCGTPPPAACQPTNEAWETGNVASISARTICFYDASLYPASLTKGFYCRIHSSPAHTGTMFGALEVTLPITLTLDKNFALGNVILSWSGGSSRFKVERSTNDPTFAVSATVNPDGGVTGTTRTEVGEVGNPQNRFYLVRNWQSNEPL